MMGKRSTEMLVKLLISLPSPFKAVLMSRMEGDIKGTPTLQRCWYSLWSLMNSDVVYRVSVVGGKEVAQLLRSVVGRVR